MKLLLDENLPKRLKGALAEYEVYTVRDKGWQSELNGKILKLMWKQMDSITGIIPPVINGC